MKKLVVSEFISVDGVFEDPGGAESTEFGGWSMKYADQEYQKYKFDELKSADTLLLGRKTYEGFAAAWPKMEGTGEFGEMMNSYPKYVVTSTLEKLEWNDSHVLRGDLVAEINKLRGQDGKDILVAGSGQLVRFLLDNKLVDKLCLLVNPVILGKGKHLFDGAKMKELRQVNCKSMSSGAVVLEYELQLSAG